MQSAPMRVDAVVDFGYFQVRISTEPAAKPAGIAQLVERHVANVKVAGSNPVSRSEALTWRFEPQPEKLFAPPGANLFLVP